MGEDEALPRHFARKLKKDPARKLLGFAECTDLSDAGTGMKVPISGGHNVIRRNGTSQLPDLSIRKQEELESKLEEASTFYLPLLDKPPAFVPCLGLFGLPISCSELTKQPS